MKGFIKKLVTEPGSASSPVTMAAIVRDGRGRYLVKAELAVT